MQEAPPVRDGSKALTILRERILRLELSPGSVLDENALAATLSLSRTPVREAIIKLISEGMAIRDGRFARVAPLNFDEVPRLYEALLISSRMINRLAAEHRTDQDILEIKAASSTFDRHMYSGDDMQRQSANVDFHLAIARAAHNLYFYDFYHKTLTASSRLSRACFAGAGNTGGETGPVSKRHDPELHAHVTETAQQHALMVTAIVQKDIDEADRLAELHQELACNRIRHLMFSMRPSIQNVPLGAKMAYA